MEAMYRCFQGSKRLNPAAELPLIVIDSRKDENGAASEHYIFTGLEKPSLLASGITIERGKMEAEDFKVLISIEDIVASQLQSACGALEATLFEGQKPLHDLIYWEGTPFTFSAVEDQIVLRYFLRDKYRHDFAKMFEATKWNTLGALKTKFELCSKLVVKNT